MLGSKGWGTALALVLGAMAIGAATTGETAAPAMRMVDDFRLSDQNYLSHQLYRKGTPRRWC